MYKSPMEGEELKGDRLQTEKRLAIGKDQTTVGDRLQPSLTGPSMFNAAEQRRGQSLCCHPHTGGHLWSQQGGGRP